MARVIPEKGSGGMGKLDCSVEDCERIVAIKSRGWCSAHYQRWQKYGNPLDGGPSRIHGRITCSIKGCEDSTVARGYCDFHYGRWPNTAIPLRERRAGFAEVL
jgi:hypothetical protein